MILEYLISTIEFVINLVLGRLKRSTSKKNLVADYKRTRSLHSFNTQGQHRHFTEPLITQKKWNN